MRIAVLVLLVSMLSTEAWAQNDYAILTLSYGGAATRISTGDDARSSLNHTPRLGLTVYGGDWFLEISASPLSRPTGVTNELAAHFVTSALGGAEVGVHLPGTTGNLAVALLVDATVVGIADPARNQPWRVGGRGLDGGVAVHYAFPIGRVRFDPSLGAGVAVVTSSGGTFSGAWANAEIDLIAKLTKVLSLVVTGGIDVRTYASRDDDRTFDARAVRFEIGVGLHDIFGIGHNDP